MDQNRADDSDLEQPTGFKPDKDERPRMPEPLPVWISAIDDVRLPAAAGVERQLDAFYVTLLGFVRDNPAELVYRAENLKLVFAVAEQPIERDRYPILQIQIPLLADAEQKLIDGRFAYQRQRGLIPGSECLVLRDPAGNWVELVENREIR